MGMIRDGRELLSMRSDLAKDTRRLIRQYDKKREEADDLLALDIGIRIDGQPRGTDISDPTAKTAESREELLDDIRAIEDGFIVVPEEYRAVIWAWVKDGERPLYSIDGAESASDRTFYEYERRFITAVAINKGWY